MDAVFLGDSPALRGEIEEAPGTGLDPLVLLGHLAAITTNIGVVITSSTTYNTPYNLARRFQALDHVTKGRVAVNIVTTGTPAAAENFGLSDHPDRDTRYRRAWEFLDVVTRLWDSWEPGWLVADKQSGRYADMSKIHRIDHQGEFFSVPWTSESAAAAPCSVSQSSEATHRISTLARCLNPPARNASATERYASDRSMYLPTNAIRTVSCGSCTRRSRSSHSVQSTSRNGRLRRRTT